MRFVLVTAVALASAAPVLAQEQKAAAPALPTGWQLRLDKANADPAALKFAIMGDGLHATTGPAAIFWQPANTMTGEYRFTASFTQMKPSLHPEAYGIFMGGKNLGEANQEYGYLLVRQDGKYTIKHRAGAEIHTIVDWTDLPAINKTDASNKGKNTLAVEVAGEYVKMFVNGQEVKSWERSYWAGDGVLGLRVNHNLDVHISDVAVTALKK